MKFGILDMLEDHKDGDFAKFFRYRSKHPKTSVYRILCVSFSSFNHETGHGVPPV